ncbi:MAG TPA: hypothetical protein VEA38_16595 [Terriglobales bacterium]|nr:hypothetical protein [Terriglobales bacterium]
MTKAEFDEATRLAGGVPPVTLALPRYRAHKVVRAGKIVAISVLANPHEEHGAASARDAILDIEIGGARPEDEVAWIPVNVSAAYMAKHDPQVGGYYVRYEDGYESWSPAGPFESGYTKLEDFLPEPGSYHWAFGWYFKRGDEGRVYIRNIEHGIEAGIPAAEWASIVASVSATGLGGPAHHMAELLHMAEEVPPAPSFWTPGQPTRPRNAPQEAMDGSPAVVVRTLGGLHIDGKFLDLRISDGALTTDEVIRIQFQCGPINEVGVNGCSIEDVIDVLTERLAGFQAGPFACAENANALDGLTAAKRWLLARTTKRQAQGVEGTNQAHQS